MSAHPEDVNPQIDAQLQQLSQHQHQQLAQQHQPPPPHPIQQVQQGSISVPIGSPGEGTSRKPKGPSVRRACVACHSGKTRCSEVLPCQNCVKRGLANVCAYPDPESETHDRAQPADVSAPSASTTGGFGAPPGYAPAQPGGLTLTHQQYYDYNGNFTGASSATFRPAKRPRPLTEEETAAITRNFTRGDFYVGSSAPVRIDPRLPVRLTLGEGDQVHFNVGNYDQA